MSEAMIEKVETLFAAVKVAREEANGALVDTAAGKKIASAALDYIFAK